MTRPLKVLVIDDDPIVLETVRERLARRGHWVTTRDHALGSTHAVRADTPDIVLLDVLMPVLNGDQLADLLRADQDGARVGVILHSSKPTEELSAIARRVGALGAIRKTADDTAFMHEFERLVQMRGVRR